MLEKVGEEWKVLDPSEHGFDSTSDSAFNAIMAHYLSLHAPLVAHDVVSMLADVISLICRAWHAYGSGVR